MIEIRAKLLTMSAATIDRVLSQGKARAAGRRNKVGVPSVRRNIAVQTYEGWDNPAPSYMEMDLVLHSGGRLEGSYLQTLVLTDVATGWTECVPLLVREQHLLIRILEELRIRLSFTLRGIDVDNDSVFINEMLQGHCRFHEIKLARCRPYRKNDQAWVEQRNGAVVRRAIGYRRYEGLEGSRLLARLYEALRGYVNFFQPSFKLQSEERQEVRIIKRYYAPATPRPQRSHLSPLSHRAGAVWGAVSLVLDEMGVLTKADVFAVEGFCEAYSDGQAARASLATDVIYDNDMIAVGDALTYITVGKSGPMLRPP